MNALRNILLLLIIPLFLTGQGNWDLGVFGGGATYQGDLVLTNSPHLSSTQPAFGFFVRHTFDFQWSLRLNAMRAQLAGSDQNFNNKDRNTRNFSFQSDIYETALLLEWEPFGKKRIREAFNFKKILSPYLFVGIGGLAVESNPDFYIGANDGILDKITLDQNIDNPSFHTVVPFGVGVKLDLSKQLLVGAEIGSRATFMDYLDGISIAANPDKNDWYVFGAVNVTYRFKARDEDKDDIPDRDDACPKIPGVVSSRGCPDSDGDGVEDLEDICPEIAGLPSLNGCPDSDADGIADWEDRCPTGFGSVLTMGCPDADNDKLADFEDDCPKLEGCLCRQGCPELDTTGNGIPDTNDRCSYELNQQLINNLTALDRFDALMGIDYRKFIF